MKRKWRIPLLLVLLGGLLVLGVILFPKRSDPLRTEVARIALAHGLAPMDASELTKVEREFPDAPEGVWIGYDLGERELEQIASELLRANPSAFSSSEASYDTLHIREWRFSAGEPGGSWSGMRLIESGEPSGRRRTVLLYARESESLADRLRHVLRVDD